MTSDEPPAKPATLDVNSPAEQPGGKSLKGPVSSADVLLPHNTLVIMWPPMQEAWKHEVMIMISTTMPFSLVHLREELQQVKYLSEEHPAYRDLLMQHLAL